MANRPVLIDTIVNKKILLYTYLRNSAIRGKNKERFSLIVQGSIEKYQRNEEGKTFVIIAFDDPFTNKPVRVKRFTKKAYKILDDTNTGGIDGFEGFTDRAKRPRPEKKEQLEDPKLWEAVEKLREENAKNNPVKTVTYKYTPTTTITTPYTVDYMPIAGTDWYPFSNIQTVATTTTAATEFFKKYTYTLPKVEIRENLEAIAAWAPENGTYIAGE